MVVTQQLVFPDRFLWGVATASYQIEGAADEEGRTPSIWDTFSHRPGSTLHGDNGDIACDHYHRFKQDVDLMEELGIPAYRFSIAWPRVQPDGKAAVNQKGLDHYRRLVETLRAKNIEPVATLYHWDLPQALEDGGGWLNRDTAGRFEDFARVVGSALGGHVSRWITLNEPWCASFVGYSAGKHAPGLEETGAGVIAAHHLLLGHGMAARALAQVAGGSPEVGISLNLSPVTPASDSTEDAAAAQRVDQQRNRWFLDPVLRGSYPESLLDEYLRLVGEDFLRPGDLEIIRADISFLAVNYYSPLRVAAAVSPQIAPTRHSPLGDWLGVEEQPRVDVPRTTKGWTIEPDGLSAILLRIRKDYGDIPLYVTENGAAFPDYVDPSGVVRDPERIDYLKRHFQAAHTAISQGVDLRGYFVWSLYDNFEWADGYGQRFGLVFTDYRTQERIPKQSAHWYREVIRANAIDV